jgi:hypothetical protein
VEEKLHQNKALCVNSNLLRVNMARRWNWVRLLTFCLSRVVALSLVIAILLVGGALAFAHGESKKPPRRNNLQQDGMTYKPISGVISDSYCGARHDKDADRSSAECARFCVRNGAKYVLVDGDNRYSLIGNQDQFSKFAGQRVIIKGEREGDSIRVSSLALQ